MKARKILRRVWSTLTAWRRQDEPLEHPGSDDQWSTFPRLPKVDPNPEAQLDEHDRRWTP